MWALVERSGLYDETFDVGDDYVQGCTRIAVQRVVSSYLLVCVVYRDGDIVGGKEYIEY